MGLFNLFKRKSIPDAILIKWDEGGVTQYIGRTQYGRQFFGHQEFVSPKGLSVMDYAVLYLFDEKGNHLETKHFRAARSGTSYGKTTHKLEEMISELGNVEYGDITAKPFQISIEGVVFGLVPNRKYQSVDVEPGSRISFQEPWDGEYLL